MRRIGIFIGVICLSLSLGGCVCAPWFCGPGPGGGGGGGQRGGGDGPGPR